MNSTHHTLSSIPFETFFVEKHEMQVFMAITHDYVGWKSTLLQ